MSVVWFVMGGVAICAAILANSFVFRLFDLDYFRWYLENDAVISIVFGFVALAVRLDAYPGLVSSNPWRYLLACWTLTFHLMLAWGLVLGETEHFLVPARAD